MSQSGSWVVKGIDQRAREAAREAAVSEGLTLGEYLDRLMKGSEGPQQNEIPNYSEARRPRTETASDALEKLTRRIEASEARSALAITSMDHTIHELVGRLENTQQTTAAIAGHVEGMIDQLRDTHDALKQKVRRLEEDDSAQQENLEALKALESALGKLASHVYEENAMAEQETLAIKGRVESGFMDIIERVETMETRVETGLADSARKVKEGIEQAALRAAGSTRQMAERLSTLESGVQSRFSALDRTQERLNATETRMEAIETDVSGALDSMESTFDRIHDRLSRAETTTDSALKNLETSFSSLDERIDSVASKIDPDLASRLRSEFEARFEDLMKSVRDTVDTVRQELAEEITRTAPAEAMVAEVRETIGNLQERVEAGETRLAASEERQADAIEKVSEQVTALNDTFDTRLREVEERSDSAASEAVREEIERLGKTVSDRIDELAEDLTQRVTDSETRSASAIEQIGDQVAAATNRLQLRQNEAIKTLAEQVDENRRKADARLSDALASVSERLEQMQTQANASLSPVQKALAMLAARLESLEDITSPPGGEEEVTFDTSYTPETELAGDEAGETFEEFRTFDEFDDFEDFGGFGDVDEAEGAEAAVDLGVHVAMPEPEVPAEPASEPDAEDLADDAVAFESDEDYVGTAEEDVFEEAEEFEAGIESWESVEEDARASAAPAATEVTAETSFEDDFDAIRAAVEGLSFAHSEPEAATADDEEDFEEEDFIETVAEADGDEEEIVADAIFETDAEEAFPDPLDALDGLDEAHTEARESDIFDDEEFEVLDLPAASEVPKEEVAAEADKPLDSDTADYLSRARKAAMAANFGRAGGSATRVSTRPTARMVTTGGGSRLPLIAAASAVAIAGVAAGGYLYLRGKQDAPVQKTPADTYVDPGALAAAAASADETVIEDPSTADMEDELFDDGTAAASLAATDAAGYAPIPPAVSVEAAAASGNYIAQYQLAQDKLAAGDFAGGADLMRKAAQKGLPIAEYALAKLHEKGTGVPKDLALAREWTEKAANGGNVKAMHDLAVFMAEGDGGEQTYAGAVQWFRKGAEFGVVDSQYNLGVLYEQGLGISPNLTESLFWFNVAARNGDGGAPAKVAELKDRVSAEAAAQAASRAETWTPSSANGIANGRFGAQPWNIGNPLQVVAVQKALSTLGYDVGVADGIMGASTALAIREFQTANGLTATGTVTPALIETLNAGATAN
ncbi:MAG: peptidoglycan-binding protein [Hyphomonas sp.]